MASIDVQQGRAWGAGAAPRSPDELVGHTSRLCPMIGSGLDPNQPKRFPVASMRPTHSHGGVARPLRVDSGL